jgi:hypothetical protein
VDEAVITRGEVVELLFIVNGIFTVLQRFELMLGGENGEEEADEG